MAVLMFAGIFMVGLPAIELVGIAMKTALSALKSAFGSIEETATATNYIYGWWSNQDAVTMVHRVFETAMITAVIMIGSHLLKCKKLRFGQMTVWSLLVMPIVLTLVSGLATVIQYAGDALMVKVLGGLYQGNLDYLSKAFTGMLPEVTVSLLERWMGSCVVVFITYCVSNIRAMVKGRAKSSDAIEKITSEYYSWKSNRADKKSAEMKTVVESSKGKVIPFPKKSA